MSRCVIPSDEGWRAGAFSGEPKPAGKPATGERSDPEKQGHGGRAAGHSPVYRMSLSHCLTYA